jgi:protein-S-isoprenylcysteine O-methyltransferase Ste14
VISAGDLLARGALLYFAALALFYLLERSPTESKSVAFFRVLARFARAPLRTWRQGLSPHERLAVLATLLKAFFAPIMAMALVAHFGRMAETGLALAEEPWNAYSTFKTLLDSNLFWFVFSAIMLVDLFWFTVGYLVELPQLRNEIRSVDSTWLGAGSALICYVPFNLATSAILGWYVDEFPKFGSSDLHVALNAVLLVLMAVYAWASIALGFKASNLTHRGVVAKGPYAFVRHPAYTCKNIAWWIGSLPAISLAFGVSAWAGVSAIASVVGWTMIYILRALTEEDHLKRVDGEYAAYAQQVRYRFIPGVV